MAFQLTLVGGVVSSMVLVLIWVNNELRFVIVLAYPLSMPPPPYVGPVRVSIYCVLIKFLTYILTKHVNKMVPDLQTMCFSKKGKEKVFNSGLVDNSTLFRSFLVCSLMATMLEICIFDIFY